jgi:hypothetical protein
MKAKAAEAKADEGIGPKAGRLVCDLLLPGASQLMAGNVKSGVLHLAGGVAGKIFFGPVGWLYAAVNSYSNSTTEKHLHQHFTSGDSSTASP